MFDEEDGGTELQAENDNLVLICGKASTGKSRSLKNLKNQDGVVYLNCENNKKLPFKTDFLQAKITDPYQVYEAFEAAEEDDDIHTIVIDTLTFLMDMYESVHIFNSANTQQGWGNYYQFAKRLFSHYIANSTKNIIILAHTTNTEVEEGNKVSFETLVKVKGSLMNIGVESFFSTIVITKRMPVKKLKEYENDNLVITDREAKLGFKYVFQTLQTKDTIHERMRASDDMWTDAETFIDNNAQTVIDRLHEYYD